MRLQLAWVFVVVATLTFQSNSVDAQGRGGSPRSGNSGAAGGFGNNNPNGAGRNNTGGFSIQAGPGGIQFGLGNAPNSGRPGVNNGNSFNGNNFNGNNFNGNNFNGNNNGNNVNQWNNNNWNNNWNRPGWNNNPWNNGTVVRPPVVVTPVVPAPFGTPSTVLPPGPPAEPIVLVNPADTQAAVEYRVNQFSYVLAPGNTQQLPGDRVWTIEYQRGGAFGSQAYTLAPGSTYRFAPGARGWEMFVVTPAAAAQVPPPATN